jgi:hypothetical protein
LRCFAPASKTQIPLYKKECGTPPRSLPFPVVSLLSHLSARLSIALTINITYFHVRTSPICKNATQHLSSSRPSTRSRRPVLLGEAVLVHADDMPSSHPQLRSLYHPFLHAFKLHLSSCTIESCSQSRLPHPRH